MIIIAYKPGQLANRLFLFAKFLAYGYEHSVVILNPSFDDYKDYFLKTHNQFIPASGDFRGYSSKTLISFFYKVLFLTGRVIHRLKIDSKRLSVTYLDWEDQYDLNSDSRLSSGGLHFVQGWGFAADKLLEIHKQKVIDFFIPATEFKLDIDAFLKKIGSKERLIGVHIRHGDYRFFEGGKYYYSLDEYKSIMKSLNDSYPELNFLICTNNKEISVNDFNGFHVTMAPGHELTDLYLLAKCDYIIGPPSTYSLWASFYGDVPLYQIKDKKTDIRLEEFKRWS